MNNGATKSENQRQMFRDKNELLLQFKATTAVNGVYKSFNLAYYLKSLERQVYIHICENMETFFPMFFALLV